MRPRVIFGVCVAVAIVSGVARFAWVGVTGAAPWLDAVFLIAAGLALLSGSRLLSMKARRSIEVDIDRGAESNGV